MANYTIIGGDGKKYGPISGEDLRKWIAEERLNAHSLVKAESDAEFRPLAAFPEFADALQSHAGTAATDSPAIHSAGWRERDYELDIGGCMSQGWNLFKENMGVLLGTFLLGMLLILVAGGVVNVIALALMPKTLLHSIAFRQFFNLGVQALLALVNGPLLGGMLYVFIQTIRGQPTGIGEMFVGFQRGFSQLFLGNFLTTFAAGLCLLPFNLVQAAKFEPMLEQLRHASPADIQQILPQFGSAFFSVLPVLAVCMVPMIYLAVNWQFTLPLIIDRQMSFWEAMKASWRQVHKHWWQLFGLVVVVGLVNLAGLCVCCIGILFTMPVTLAATMYAYETLFNAEKN